MANIGALAIMGKSASPAAEFPRVHWRAEGDGMFSEYLGTPDEFTTYCGQMSPDWRLIFAFPCDDTSIPNGLAMIEKVKRGEPT